MIKKAYVRSKHPKISLYIASVQTLRIEATEMMTDQMNLTTDNAVEVHHETTAITKIVSHRSDIVLHHQSEIIMTKAVLLKLIMHVPNIITINESQDLIVLLIDHTDHLRDVIPNLDTDHVRIRVTTYSQNILLHLDLVQEQEILDILDLAFTLLQETTLIQYKPNH